MNSNQNYAEFRLAARLFSESDTTCNRSNILKRIIESWFLDNLNQPVTSIELSLGINKHYSLLFSKDEIFNIIIEDQKKDSSHHFEIEHSGSEKYQITLSHNRYETLKANNTKCIEDFILEFIGLNSQTIKNEKSVKSAIYKFIYFFSQSNKETFSALLDPKHDKTIGSLSIDQSKFNSDEVAIVNDFLNWDNPDKDNTILNIANYAIQYCIVSNNIKTTIEQRFFTNCNLYLDTNIIFRALGLNGETRKDLTKLTLTKFLQMKQKILITQFTAEEYRGTITDKISKIETLFISNVKPRTYSEILIDKDIYSFYNNWKSKNPKLSIEDFSYYLESIYQQFLIDFEVEIEPKPENSTNSEKSDALRKSIYGFKSSEYSKKGSTRFKSSTNEAALHDAEVISLIKTKRGSYNKNIQETRHYFLSTDQNLRRWDHQNCSTNETPIVILPSNWLTILLRFTSRTENDVKSFISFINLSQRNSSITNLNALTIIDTISSFSENPDEQKLLFNVYINKNADKIIYGNIAPSQIQEDVKEFIPHELAVANRNISRLNASLSEQNEQHKQDISELKKTIENNTTTITESNIKYDSLLQNDSNKDTKINDLTQTVNLYKRCIWGFFSITTLFILLLIVIFYYGFRDWEYNYIYFLIASYNDNASQSDSNISIGIGITLYLAILIGDIKLFWSFVLFPNNKLS